MKQKIKNILEKSINELNTMISDNKNEIKSNSQVLIGEKGILDSLGYLNLMVAVENNIKEVFDFEFSFIDFIDGDLKDNPFYTIEALETFLLKHLNDKK